MFQLELNYGDECTILNLLKTNELHTLKGEILQHMNYFNKVI